MTEWYQFALGDYEVNLILFISFILTAVILWFTLFEEQKE